MDGEMSSEKSGTSEENNNNNNNNNVNNSNSKRGRGRGKNKSRSSSKEEVWDITEGDGGVIKLKRKATNLR